MIKIDNINTVTHSKKLIKMIREKIGFKNILISDDLSMKSLKGTLKENTIKTFNSGCNIVLHCNANFKEMEIIGKNSPLINKFIHSCSLSCLRTLLMNYLGENLRVH